MALESTGWITIREVWKLIKSLKRSSTTKLHLLKPLRPRSERLNMTRISFINKIRSSTRKSEFCELNLKLLH